MFAARAASSLCVGIRVQVYNMGRGRAAPLCSRDPVGQKSIIIAFHDNLCSALGCLGQLKIF